MLLQKVPKGHNMTVLESKFIEYQATPDEAHEQ